MTSGNEPVAGETARERDQAALDRLIESSTPCIVVNSSDERHVIDLVISTAMATGHRVARWSAVRGLTIGIDEQPDPIHETESLVAALWHLRQQHAAPPDRHRRDGAWLAVLHDAGPHLEDARTRRMLRELVLHWSDGGGTLVMLDAQDSLPSELEPYARRFDPSLPDAPELERIVRRTVRDWARRGAVEASLRRSELDLLVRNLRGLGRPEAAQLIREAVADDRRLDAADLPRILAWKREQLHRGGALEFVEAPVNLDDVAGLDRLKSWLDVRREAFDRRDPDPTAPPPRGVLLLGVQGAGKSLSAKAIATAWGVPLMRLDPGALYDRFVGESERRLRESLTQVEAMSPIVLWVDEIEKGFASAASRSTDGGLSQRMFGTLLTWMQDHRAAVFLVATANDIEALPPELLRKGRFDEIFFVDLPNREVREAILGIHLRRRELDPAKYDCARLADEADGFSGAELEQAVIGAIHEARARGESPTNEDIANELRRSPPLSVTMREKIEGLRRWAKGRCVPAD